MSALQVSFNSNGYWVGERVTGVTNYFADPFILQARLPDSRVPANQFTGLTTVMVQAEPPRTGEYSMVLFLAFSFAYGVCRLAL